MSWFGDDLKLPQDDSNVKRVEGLQKARDEYIVDDHKLNLTETVMAYDSPGKFEPVWLAKVLGVVLESAVNTAQARSIEDRVSRLHASHVKRAARISAHRNPIAAAISETQAIHDENQYQEHELRCEHIDDYDNLFRVFDLPKVGQGKGMDRPAFRDDWFAASRLMGPNPAWIRRATTAMPDDYASMEEFGKGSRDPASFAKAIDEGRVFVSDYSLLLDVKPLAGAFKPPAKPSILEDLPDLPDLELRDKDPQAWREERAEWIETVWKPYREQYAEREANGYKDCRFQKVLTAPVAVFELSADGTRLECIGIQCLPASGGASARIYRPHEQWAWQQAKTMLQVADGNVHQAISHLGETHMVQEVCNLAMLRQLSKVHPLHHLLAPHFEGTFAINSAADSSLVGPSSGVDSVMMGTIGTSVAAVHAGMKLYDFNAKMFPNQVESRGFADEVTAKLHYSYREDGMKVWQTYHRFVEGYVDHYYGSDGDVAADFELQAFTKEVSRGGFQNVGEGGTGSVQTKAYLVDMMTHIIFNGSAQHAAVNFPQVDLMSYVPNQPLAAYAFKAEDVTEKDWLNCLPPMPAAGQQLNLGQLLGSIHYTELGHYPSKLFGVSHYFKPDEIKGLNDELISSFEALEASIDARIASGKDNYHYLKPSTIPMSINI